MKIKIAMVIALGLLPLFSEAGSTRKDITIKEVGLSQNTNRVFVVSSDKATDSICSDQDYYAMELGSAESFLFYSAALNAMNEGKKMRVQYVTDGVCLSNAPRVDVFWNLNF